MPLPKPARRKLIHTREIVCRGYEREDGLWDIEGELTDVKTYSFDNQDRGGIHAGEPIHHMRLRLTLDVDLTVVDVAAATEASPYRLCGDIATAYEALKGLRIGPGWIKAVRSRLGGVSGCTHLTDMLLGPLSTTAYQTVGDARTKRHSPKPDGSKPALLDTCHALSTESPIVARDWPAFYSGKDPA